LDTPSYMVELQQKGLICTIWKSPHLRDESHWHGLPIWINYP